MIKLFSPSATSFNSMGLGSLSEALACTVTEERNGDFTLELEYPTSGRLFNEIGLRSIIVAKPNPFDEPQAFRVYKITKTIKKTVTINAEHISFDMSGIVVGPFTSGTGFSSIFNAILSNTVPPQFPAGSGKFALFTDKTTETAQIRTVPITLRALLGGENKSLLDNYGGEWKFDNYNCTLYENRGQDRGVVIKYGVDLIDMKQEEECSELFTGIAPYYTDPESDATIMLDNLIVRVADAYDQDPPVYNYDKFTTHDFTNSFDRTPTKAQLIDETKRYIRDEKIGIPKVSLTLSFANLRKTMEYARFVELQKVMLCDTITVLFPEMNIRTTAKVEKVEYDAIKDEYKSIDVGDAKKTLADTISGNSTDVEKISTTYATVSDVSGTRIIEKVNSADVSSGGINATQVSTSGNQNVDQALRETLKSVTTYYGSFDIEISPDRSSPGWGTSSPAREENKYIWQYIDYFYADNRHEYTEPINLSGLKGADGKSVSILGSYDTIEQLRAAHPIGNVGDAYLVDGDLYVWDPTLNDWNNVGKIKGQSLSRVTTEYGTSSSSTVPPTSWTTYVPNYNPNYWIWTREKQEFVDPIETKYSQPVVDNSLTGFGTQLYQQGNKIAMVVKTVTGEDEINSAAIMLAINGDTSSAIIDADKTQITGLLTNGSTTVSGNCIQTGLIISNDGQSYFDLDRSLLSATQWKKDRFRMTTSTGSIKGTVPIVTSEIQYAEDGRAYDLWSPTETYQINNIVRHNGVAWRAVFPSGGSNPAVEPGSPGSYGYWEEYSWNPIFRFYKQDVPGETNPSAGSGFAFSTAEGWYDFNDLTNASERTRHLGVRRINRDNLSSTDYSRVMNGITSSGIVTVPGSVSGPATITVYYQDTDMTYIQPLVKPFITASFYDDGQVSGILQSGTIRIHNITFSGFTISIDNATDGKPRRVAWIAHKNP